MGGAKHSDFSLIGHRFSCQPASSKVRLSLRSLYFNERAAARLCANFITVVKYSPPASSPPQQPTHGERVCTLHSAIGRPWSHALFLIPRRSRFIAFSRIQPAIKHISRPASARARWILPGLRLAASHPLPPKGGFF